MTDYERLIHDIEHREEALLFLADLIEDAGGDLPTAHGLRWLARELRWPILVDGHWEWWASSKRNYQCNLLPPIQKRLRALLSLGRGETARFDSAAAALLAAARCVLSEEEAQELRQPSLPGVQP